MSETQRMFSLDGFCCLVTGAGGGIGRATASMLTAQGARVVLNDIDANAASDAAEACGGMAPAGAQGDMTDPEAAVRAVAATIEALGRIDVLVNNAAAPTPLVQFARTSQTDWPSHLSYMYATLNCTHAVLPHMIEQGWGRIVNVTSIAGGVGVDRMVLYGAGKGAIHAFSLGLGKEIAASGVTVNCVAPGTVDTPRQRAREPHERDQRMARVPMGRFAAPEEIGATVAFLASREAAYITGEVLYVDGGRP